jgi:hypothetical protein
MDGYLSQALDYLNVSTFELGLLVNFGGKSLKYKPIIL